MVLAHLASVKHGVKRRHLVHSDRRHIQDLCYLQRGSEYYLSLGAARRLAEGPTAQLALFIALRLSQPLFCFCARSSIGITAEAL